MMRWTRVRLWLGSLLDRRRFDHELEDELRFHLEARTETLVAQGLEPGAARRQARLEFGNPASVRDRVTELRRGVWFEQLGQDLRYAGRLVRRYPGFSAVAVMSLALGIGTAGTVFSLADGLLLRPLSVPAPAEVISVTARHPEEAGAYRAISFPNFEDLRNRATSVELLAFRPTLLGVTRTLDGTPDTRSGLVVSANFFDALDIRPADGRGFLPAEGEAPGRDPVMVVSHDFWQSALTADPGVVGSTLWVNGLAVTVVGVAPASFTGMDPTSRPAFFIPAMMADALGGAGATLDDRTDRGFVVKGRLGPGSSRRQADAELATLWGGLTDAYPVANERLSLSVLSELEFRLLWEPIVA